MGAEPWDIRVHYQPNLNDALSDARRLAFESHWLAAKDGGQYASLEDLDAAVSRSNDAADPSGDFDLDDIGDGEGFDDVDGWMFEGTGSVIDIVRVGPKPEPCVAGVLDGDEAISRFGTSTPTNAVVESKLSELYGELDRGSAFAVVIHTESGAPVEVRFLGYSFD